MQTLLYVLQYSTYYNTLVLCYYYKTPQDKANSSRNTETNHK